MYISCGMARHMSVNGWWWNLVGSVRRWKGNLRPSTVTPLMTMGFRPNEDGIWSAWVTTLISSGQLSAGQLLWLI